MPNYLGIDWGGTYIKAGVIDCRGKILAEKVFSSSTLKAKPVFIAKIKDLLDDFAAFDPQAVGIGAPGIIDVRRGFIYYLPNVPGWKNYPLKTDLEKKLKLPVFVENDANLFGLAETRLGAARGSRNVICLTLGTGLGAGVIVGGRLLEARTSAGELAHVPIVLDGPVCGCGGRGCIETFVGNRYLTRRYRALSGRAGEITVKDIYRRARAGDRYAVAAWKEFSHALGMFLAGMVNIFAPETIVFGGGVSGAFDLFAPLVKKTIKQQAMWPQFKGLKLVRARLSQPGIIGAGLLAMDRMK